MTQDHYATLGVEPRAEAAAIRAAYLALMRRYHPDKNDSPAAVERAHAIIAAFAVLGDVEKRLHYDWGRRRAAEAAEEARRSWRGWGPRAVMVAGGVLLLLVTVMVMPPVPIAVPPADLPFPPRPPRRARFRTPSPRRCQRSRQLPRCPRPRVPAAPVAPEPVVADAMTPPAIEVRPRATADRLAPVAAPRLAARAATPPRAATAPKATPAKIKARCRQARPGAEAAICNDDNLTALDGNVLTFYNQSLVFGTAAKRAALLDARGNFLARREACHRRCLPARAPPRAFARDVGDRRESARGPGTVSVAARASCERSSGVAGR